MNPYKRAGRIVDNINRPHHIGNGPPPEIYNPHGAIVGNSQRITHDLFGNITNHGVNHGTLIGGSSPGVNTGIINNGDNYGTLMSGFNTGVDTGFNRGINTGINTGISHNVNHGIIGGNGGKVRHAWHQYERWHKLRQPGLHR
jgi:hypothetical protein